MIGMFIGGFIAGAFTCFATLVFFAILSLKRKQRLVKELTGNVKCNYSFHPKNVKKGGSK